jgi:3-oxoadipate enol-lactonase/4-carboxymuconolactone decarboxylase
VTVELHYKITGPPAGTPVVLSGSLGSDLRMWDPQVDSLVAAGFRVIRYDHRGHGESPAPDGPYSLEDLATDALRMLDHLGLRRVSWVGLSLGGMVGMWLAQHEPSRVERLVLCCTSAALGPASMWQERASVARTQGMAALAEPVVARWVTPAASPELVKWLQEMVASHSPEGYASCCTAIETMSIEDDLPSITAPTLVIAGEDDPATPPDHAQRIAAAVPDARLEIVSGAAHLGNVEKPSVFAGLIIDHLRPDRRALGMSVRRSVLGDTHVDRAVAATTEFTRPFQEYITEGAWGSVWSRPGLDRRTRSAVTLAALTALRAHEELPMHVRAARQNGLSEAEIAEILLHTTVYAGAPAGNAAFAIAKRTLEED